MTTDVSSSSTTHTVPEPASVRSHDATSTATSNGYQATASQVEDEPYTIKCICGFEEDDGSTVFCEKCETWQHMECYYPGKKPQDINNDVHNCVDCEPRSLDPGRANERQRRRKEQQNGQGDRKTKRPPSKSHKKKVRESSQPSTTTNGWSPSDRQLHESSLSVDRKNGISRDQQPPTKRPKTSHRNSSSTSSLPSNNSPSLYQSLAHLRNGRSPSDPLSANNQTNGPSTDLFSLHFIRVHREDPGDSDLDANLFSNITVPRDLSTWLQDPDALRDATNAHSPGDVFQRVQGDFDSLAKPVIEKKTKKDPSIECHGQYPIWQYATVNSVVPKNGLVGELKGQVGHLHDYLQNPDNNWDSLRHPLPFVFFHPRLPVYIDTREEGTRCRYIRRSCRPNVEMKTLISNGTEHHFCFHALEEIQPDTEITLGWDMDENISRLMDRALVSAGSTGIKVEPLTELELDSLSSWVEQVLANNGGCACESPESCIMARFDRRASNVSSPTKNDLKGNKSRKAKWMGPQASPLITGQASNGRAGSEGLQHRDRDEDADDSRSTSGSVRSKPGSRDMTPATHFSSDAPLTSAGSELSDREKRKLAAMERTFEQIEQNTHSTAQKKKKRTSGGSSATTPATSNSVGILSQIPIGSETDLQSQKATHPAQSFDSNAATATPVAMTRKEYANATTSPAQAGSPTSHSRQRSGSFESSSRPSLPTIAPPPRQATYVDTAMQTEAANELDSWYYRPALGPRPIFNHVPLTQRLLKRRHEDRLRYEVEKKRRLDEEVVPSKDEPMTDAPTATVSQTPSSLAASTSQAEGPSILPDSVSLPDATTPGTTNGDGSASSTIQPLDPNVQKSRIPPGDPNLDGRQRLQKQHLQESSGAAAEHAASDARTSTSPTLTKPAPPTWPSATNAGVNDASRSLNGHRNPDLRVQLPPTPLFTGHSPTTPSTGSIAQSPQSSSHLSTTFSPTAPSAVQPSPVKKKLSLSDYKRMKSADATAMATSERQQSSAAGSPTLTHNTLKASSLSSSTVPTAARDASPTVPSTAPGLSGIAIEGSAIVDSPATEVPDPIAPP